MQLQLAGRARPCVNRRFWWRKPGLRAGAAGAGRRGLWRDRRRGAWRGQARAPACRCCASAISPSAAPARRRPPWRSPTCCAEAGERVFCLSRGYGGSVAGPKRVDAHADSAAQVGDEALLLARVAPTIVARDRVAGAAAGRARKAPASSSWTTACRTPRSPRISPSPWSTAGAASATAACFPPARCARRSTRSWRAPTRCWWSARRAAPPMSSPPPSARGLPVLHGRLVPDRGRGRPRLQGRKVLGLRRHRRSGQVLRHRRRSRHRRRAAPGLSRPSPLQRRGGGRPDDGGRARRARRCSPPRRTAPA